MLLLIGKQLTFASLEVHTQKPDDISRHFLPKIIYEGARER